VKFICLCLLVLFGAGGCDRDEPVPQDAGPPTQAGPKTVSTPSPAALSPGHAVYAHYCADCHDAGPGHPGTMQLGERLGAERAVLRTRTDLTPEYVKAIVRNGFQMMPAFRPTEIADSELDALAAHVTAGRATP
jgi:mono/diheme cytochrome c family protein